VVSMVIGILVLIDTPDPAVRIGLATALSVALPFAVIFLILLIALFKSLRQKVSTGNEGMVGLVGIAETEIHRQGFVRVRGEYWSAFADTVIAPGQPVRVVAVDNLTVRVERVPE
jgi:membrane-bound serine protease (ClpP class)